MKLKSLLFSLLFVIACYTGEVSQPTNSLPPSSIPMDYDTDASVHKDSGIDSSFLNAGDSGVDGSACELVGTIVGHCLTHQGTLCVGYASNHEAECLKSGLVTGWYPGPCGTNDSDSSNLNRSSGGCKDECGIIFWSYPLGGVPPTDRTRRDVSKMCEDAGLVYIPAQ